MGDTEPLTIDSIKSMAYEQGFEVDDALAEVLLRNARIHVRAAIVVHKRSRAPQPSIDPVPSFGAFPENVRRIFGLGTTFERKNRSGLNPNLHDVGPQLGTSYKSALFQVAGSDFKAANQTREGEPYNVQVLVHNQIAKFSSASDTDQHAIEMAALIQAAAPSGRISNEDMRAHRPWTTKERLQLRLVYCPAHDLLTLHESFKEHPAYKDRSAFVDFSAAEMARILTLFRGEDAKVNWVQRPDGSATLLLWHPFVAYALRWSRFPNRNRKKAPKKHD